MIPSLRRNILGAFVLALVASATTTTTTTTTSTDGGGWPWWAWFLQMLGICCFLNVCCGGILGGIFSGRKKKRAPVQQYVEPRPVPMPMQMHAPTQPMQPPMMMTVPSTGPMMGGSVQHGNHDDAHGHHHGTTGLMSAHI